MKYNDPNILIKLSNALDSSIMSAKQELSHTQNQLEALSHSKQIVDQSINTISGDAGAAYLPAASMSIFPTGNLAIPFCNQFTQAQPGAERRLLSDQIYETVSSGLSAFLNEADSEGLAIPANLTNELNSAKQELMSLEDRLRKRLSSYSESLELMLEGAVASYRDVSNPLRMANAGNALREMLGRFLNEVAPDKRVKNAPWFKPDSTSRSGVTRRHRIEFSIFGNLDKDKFPSGFTNQSEQLADELIKDISGLNSYTHVNEKSLAREDSEAFGLFASVIQKFILLISAIESARMLVEEDLTIRIQEQLDDLFTSDFFDELDCLSTHTRPQGACDVEVISVSFDETTVNFSGSGSVDCDLQYGSDGDVRRGDGVECSASFPFSFSGYVPINELDAVDVDRGSISIDTSSFYDDEDY
jgi:ABC-type transporter Mla MlaB component